MSSSVPGEVSGAPALADALPAAEHHCSRAVAHLEGRAARGDLLEALVALLEAAGGPDVGNLVRTHVERTGAAVPARCATDRGRVRVLLAALRLHSAAEGELRDRLRAAGLADLDGHGTSDPLPGRAARARHSETVLRTRRWTVDRVVVALGGADLLATAAGRWDDALARGLPPDLSQGETGGPADPR
jgi:hypothetical protein